MCLACSLQFLQRFPERGPVSYLCGMFESEHIELPRNVVDLVCCLHENALDDESIIDICMRLFGHEEMTERMILYLSLCNRTSDEIVSFVNSLA